MQGALEVIEELVEIDRSGSVIGIKTYLQF